MKTLLLILIFASVCNGQSLYQKYYAPNDLTFDYYRGVGVQMSSFYLFKAIEDRPIINGLGSLIVGVCNSLFERSLNGKIVSNMGSVGGLFTVIVLEDNKNKKELRKLENQKYKYSFKDL